MIRSRFARVLLVASIVAAAGCGGRGGSKDPNAPANPLASQPDDWSDTGLELIKLSDVKFVQGNEWVGHLSVKYRFAEGGPDPATWYFCEMREKGSDSTNVMTKVAEAQGKDLKAEGTFECGVAVRVEEAPKWLESLEVLVRAGPRREGAMRKISNLAWASGADEPKKDETAEDIKRFQGAWTLVAIENNGEVVAPETFKGRKLIVKGDDTVFMQGDEVYSRSKQKIDATTSPKQIDITQAEGPEKGKVTKGIYRLDGDDLTICYIYPGEGRPTDFTAVKGSGRILLKFRREKR